MLVKRLMVLLVSCSLSWAALAQKTDGALSGTIRSSKGEMLVGASVLLKESQSGSQADEYGRYKISNIRPGAYTVLITSVGYETQSQRVVVKSGESVRLDFSLEESSTSLDEIEITGKTESQEAREAAFTVNAIDTRQFANTTADLNQILNRTTGVRIREQGGMGSDFSFSINGLSGKAVKFFIDGVPMDVLGSAVSLNNIPVNLAERVEVYKGGVPVSLGADALGGAVNVITSQKVNNYMDASYSYGSFNTHRAALTGQVKLPGPGIVIKANGFYNYSNNNYLMKGVEVPEAGLFVSKDVKRFHNDYSAIMGQIEAGVRNKKWADLLFAGYAHSSSDQQLQTGFRQDIVYGAATRNNAAHNGSIRYTKDNLFVKGLNLNLYGSISQDHAIITDTASHRYAWDGSYMGAAPSGEFERGKFINHILRPKTFLRTNVSYEINPVHSLNFNLTIDRVKNDSYDELLTDHDDIIDILGKRIAGIAYQQNLFNKKLTNTFFGKYYGLKLAQDVVDEAAGNDTDNSSLLNNYGYGIASRYLLTTGLGIKTSFEHAYRLQEVEEMFGDGMTVVANPDLKPESSNNINAGLFFGKRFKKHSIFIETGGFYRDADDFIFAVAHQRSNATRYENKSSVRVTGVEGEARYTWSDLLSVVVNATYQNSVNMTRYTRAGSATPEATYKNKIPNQPWLFGNAELTISKNSPFGHKDTRIQFNWYTQYVHWFYLTWEAYGSSNGKANIPDQYIHSASVSYSFKNNRYNISLEGKNLTDNLAYDNFKLQKPGRSFAVKVRYFIK